MRKSPRPTSISPNYRHPKNLVNHRFGALPRSSSSTRTAVVRGFGYESVTPDQVAVGGNPKRNAGKLFSLPAFPPSPKKSASTRRVHPSSTSKLEYRPPKGLISSIHVASQILK